MKIDLSNKSAIVTGGGQGIGRGIATQLALAGAAVTIAEIDPNTGAASAKDLTERGLRVAFCPVDIRSEADIQRAVEIHLDTYHSLDIVVNNAGRNQHFDASQMTVDEWEASMGLNLRGAWLCAKHALPHMASQGHGVVVNIASVHANMTQHNFFPYNVAKSGLLGLTRSIALDWGPKGIRAVTISPGYVLTPPLINGFAQAADRPAAEQRVIDLHPVRRIGQPEDIGNLVTFIVSDYASYISGTEIIVDGGLSARYAD